MKQIVCLSHMPWSSYPTRTQQLVSRLSETDVLFFQPPGPKPSPKGRKVRPNVMVYELPKLISIASNTAPVARFNRRRIAAYIERIMARHHFREPLLWCTTPENIHQLDYLAYRGLVYDCHRYWSELPIDWEGDLANTADVCFAASEGLQDRLVPCNQNIALLPNGVNYPLFRRELLETPSELTDLSDAKVIGFFGPLTADLDAAPLLQAAELHSDWVFLLVGPVEPSAYLPHLEQFENIRILGQKPLVELPDYMSCCHVCVNLLYRLEADSDVVPSRILEYLSAGKPVVSMLWRHQREEFPDVVYPARTAEEFISQCEAALEENPDELLRRRRDYGAAAAWDLRAEEVMRILDANALR